MSDGQWLSKRCITKRRQASWHLRCRAGVKAAKMRNNQINVVKSMSVLAFHLECSTRIVCEIPATQTWARPALDASATALGRGDVATPDPAAAPKTAPAWPDRR